ncbi:MAG TPA: class II aldolase/adducin family protein [Woeseiaceae bacterium]|nr:class II aldolase/adducin family protein [Woeseiaceae bacterium]
MGKSVKSTVSAEEWELRVNLAACYRAIAMFGWDDLVFTHISARIPGPQEHFLINSYGLFFEEMTASSLVKVDLEGNKVSDSEGEINPAGFVIHSAVHEARPDVGCIVHTHTKAGIAVSAQAGGFLPISQTSLFSYATIAYHDYEGVALNDHEKPRLVADLGDRNCLVLRNHGLLATGPTIPDAFLRMYLFETGCQIQLLAQSTGQKLVHVPDPIVSAIEAQGQAVTRGLGGQLVWPGILRKLDRRDPSFRT